MQITYRHNRRTVNDRFSTIRCMPHRANKDRDRQTYRQTHIVVACRFSRWQAACKILHRLTSKLPISYSHLALPKLTPRTFPARWSLALISDLVGILVYHNRRVQSKKVDNNMLHKCDFVQYLVKLFHKISILASNVLIHYDNLATKFFHLMQYYR